MNICAGMHMHACTHACTHPHTHTPTHTHTHTPTEALAKTGRNRSFDEAVSFCIHIPCHVNMHIFAWKLCFLYNALFIVVHLL